MSNVTTDNGLVVATWSGLSFNNVYIAIRPAGGSWSAPTEIETSAAAIRLVKDGSGAWLAWQGFSQVSALHIDSYGTIGTPEVVGTSGDPFVDELRIAAGANGSVAVAWRVHLDKPSMIAYRPAGSDWRPAETVPVNGNVEGLVVGAAGTAQLVLSQGYFRHETIVYVRRARAGVWTTPFTVSSDASVVSVAGNEEGDLAVGWQVDNNGGNVVVAARYKAADDASFGATHHLSESAPYSSYVTLAMAADGSLAAAYQIASSGAQQIQMTPADSTGTWLTPQNLSLPGFEYDVAMNAAGGFVVVSAATVGTQYVTCDATDVCGAVSSNSATGYKFPSTSYGPGGAINLVWGRGCKGEGCNPTQLVAQRGR